MELVNKIDGKELFAARSTADAAGNNIADTYAQKTEIPDVSDFVTQQELSTELNTKQDNLSTEQLYNIDNAVTSLAGVMAESKLTIEGGKITEYDGTPFAGGSSDIVHFDYNNGNPELSWSEIKAYMDTGKQLIIYDKTVATDGKTKLGYVSNYDKANNFVQFTNISNMVVEGETVNGINWAYVGNSLGWQRTFIRNGGSGGKTYTGVDPIIVDNDANTISADTADVDYQQITHDDSLVHVSNNAQYALGINTRMFPCDETVLWEGNATSFTTSETVYNFEYVKIQYKTNDNVYFLIYFPVVTDAPRRILLTGCMTGSAGVYLKVSSFTFGSSGVSFTLERGYGLNFESGYSKTDSNQITITKVIGVGRKGGV